MSASKEEGASRWHRNVWLTVAGLLLIAAAGVFSLRAGQRRTAVRQLDAAEQQVLANYRTASEHFASEEIGPRQFIDAMETDVLAPWRELQAAERKLLEQESSEEVRALLDRRLGAMKLRERAWALIVDCLKQGDKEGVARAVRKYAEADRIEADLQTEVEAEQKEDGAERR